MRRALPLLLLALALALATAACYPGPGGVGQATGSVGSTTDGRLVGGVQLTGSDEIVVLEPEKAWGAPALIYLIENAALEMRLAYPDTVPLVVGHLSQEGGGRLSPHKSHQSGRDVDLAMYSQGNVLSRRFLNMTAANLDLDKTWHLIETLVASDLVQYVLVDWDVQRLLYDHAAPGLDRADLADLFQYPRRGARTGIIRHAAGHRNHLHVRIHCPPDDRACVE